MFNFSLSRDGIYAFYCKCLCKMNWSFSRAQSPQRLSPFPSNGYTETNVNVAPQGIGVLAAGEGGGVDMDEFSNRLFDGMIIADEILDC